MKKFLSVFIIVLIISSPLSYCKWCPEACRFSPTTVLALDGLPFDIHEGAVSCNMFDRGLGNLSLYNRDTQKEQLIAEWFDLDSSYDVFMEDSTIHLILQTDIHLTKQSHTVFGIPIAYHWLDEPSLRGAEGYQQWHNDRISIASRHWAMAHAVRTE